MIGALLAKALRRVPLSLPLCSPVAPVWHTLWCWSVAPSWLPGTRNRHGGAAYPGREHDDRLYFPSYPRIAWHGIAGSAGPPAVLLVKVFVPAGAPVVIGLPLLEDPDQYPRHLPRSDALLDPMRSSKDTSSKPAVCAGFPHTAGASVVGRSHHGADATPVRHS